MARCSPAASHARSLFRESAPPPGAVAPTPGARPAAVRCGARRSGAGFGTPPRRSRPRSRCGLQERCPGRFPSERKRTAQEAKARRADAATRPILQGATARGIPAAAPRAVTAPYAARKSVRLASATSLDEAIRPARTIVAEQAAASPWCHCTAGSTPPRRRTPGGPRRTARPHRGGSRGGRTGVHLAGAGAGTPARSDLS